MTEVVSTYRVTVKTQKPYVIAKLKAKLFSQSSTDKASLQRSNLSARAIPIEGNTRTVLCPTLCPIRNLMLYSWTFKRKHYLNQCVLGTTATDVKENQKLSPDFTRRAIFLSLT